MSDQLFRTFVRESIMHTIPPGAGIVVVKNINGIWLPLGLDALDGMLDIPKGVIDKDEDPFDAALRETYEECGIDSLDFKWGNTSVVNSNDRGTITIYIAATDQEPVLEENPHSGIVEHLGAKWVDWDELIEGTYDFLVPCIEWAKNVVTKEEVAG